MICYNVGGKENCLLMFCYMFFIFNLWKQIVIIKDFISNVIYEEK